MEQLFSLEYAVSILLSGISLGGQLALIAIGYTMVYGILRLINFAHGDVFMVTSRFSMCPWLPRTRSTTCMAARR